ncbi:polyamine aminopropyltransferase [Candidatus Babeliales bacterium]|nr:polyamine aminopropyltransferase [Candidatus Babeliales bacterium]
MSCNIINISDKQYFLETQVPISSSKTKHLIQIKELLYSGKSEYQKIEVYDTYDYGKMLILDGIVQTSEKDEFIYHENICHLPMFYHKNPKKILIIGGGDGGTLREVLKHPIDKVVMVEIDKKVVEISKKYLPTISEKSFDNKKTNLIIGDGKEYIQKHKNFFDIIILDLSDPDGPAEQLITKEFYTNVKDALNINGIISVQSESLTEQPKLTITINKRLKQVFSSVKVHQAVIPTYQGGIFSLTVASNTNLNKVTFEQVEEKYKNLNLELKYYNPKIHFASTILPKYLEKIFKNIY